MAAVVGMVEDRARAQEAKEERATFARFSSV
jgi:hypothetical protein